MLLNNCPVCKSNLLTTTKIKLPEGFLKACQICSQLVSSCTKSEYESGFVEFNTQDGTMPESKNKERAFKRHKSFLNLAQKYLNKKIEDASLLDVGCSSGSFLLNAKRAGIKDLHGVEPAQKAAESAKKMGFSIYNGFLQDADFKPQTFDIITMFEVIEHLTDPIKVLDYCHLFLKKGGVLLIGTGNTNSWTVDYVKQAWEYFSLKKHGGHVSFFNQVSMQVLAKETDFELKEIKTRAVKLHEKFEKNSFSYKVTKILSQILNPFAGGFGKGHDMLAVLVKK